MKSQILNARFDTYDLKQTSQVVFQHINEGRRGWLCTVNVAILMMMRSNPALQHFVDRAAIVVADGQPLVWCAPLLDQPLPERVTGVDLIELLCATAEQENHTIYLLGGTDDIIRLSAQRLQQRYPKLTLCFADGYFTEAQAPQRAAAIKASGAAILLVGMGVPRQEQFIENQWNKLGVSIAIPVGGSFDVIAGIKLRAPLWVQKIGMEWSWRLAQDPRRLFKRYMITNSQFIYHLGKTLLSNALKKIIRKQS